jgi:hypothetical protein
MEKAMQAGDALLSLSDAGSWASLVSLAISVFSLIASSYAALAIRRVRRELISRATLPALSKALGQHLDTLGNYLQDYENTRNDFAAELAGCEANLQSVQRKVADTTKVNVYPAQWKIARYKAPLPFSKKGPQNSEHDARAIYHALKSVQQQLENFLDEQRLGG